MFGVHYPVPALTKFVFHLLNFSLSMFDHCPSELYPVMGIGGGGGVTYAN